MKINWGVRLKNPIWLMSMASLIITFVYGVLDALGVIPVFPQEKAVQAAQALFTFLGLIGVIQDPTTAGIIDSNRAMTYNEPWSDNG